MARGTCTAANFVGISSKFQVSYNKGGSRPWLKDLGVGAIILQVRVPLVSPTMDVDAPLDATALRGFTQSFQPSWSKCRPSPASLPARSPAQHT